MPKARQQYFSDEVAINKEARTFVFDDELLDKINDIDGRAEENIIEIVKVNGTPLIPDAQKAVDVPVPGVIDSLSSTSTTNSLSAYQGKILYDYIMNLQSRGRFLSNWDAANGIPVTTPFGNPYNYNPGDYYVVGIVDSTTNYRPDGATYVTGAVSTVVETETLDVSDMYVYDGTQWTLLKNTARQIAIDQTLSTTSTNPVENRVITNALNTKQDLLTAGTNITIDSSNVISAVDTTYPNLPAAEGGTADSLVTTGEKYEWSQKQGALTAGANIQINNGVISATDTVYGNLPAAQGGTDVSLVTTGDKYNWNQKQDGLTAGTNITISGGVISATDTTYNNLPAAQGGNDVTLVTTGDKYNWNNKQDRLSAGANITISGGVISANNTTYGNLPAAQGGTDVTLVTTGDKYNWNNKQDRLSAGANITINNGIISATDTTYTAGDGISIYGNVISNTKTFDPGTGSAGQVLTKTSNGYKWSNSSAAVTSVNGMTGDVTVSEFLPGSGSTGQVLKKTSSGYGWANESGGGGGGGGGGSCSCPSYYGGNGINVTSNYEIINTKPFDPVSGGSTGQVLTKTSSGYKWTSVAAGEGNVKLFSLSSTSDVTTAQAVLDWTLAGKMPIIKLNNGVQDVYYPLNSNHTGSIKYLEFLVYMGPGSGDSGRYKFDVYEQVNINYNGSTVTQVRHSINEENKTRTGTQAQYNALSSIDSSAVYNIIG